jgi:glycosyltransferase involved in cell wall biosynthesis
MRVLQLLTTTGWGGAERMACTVHRLALEHGVDSRVEVPPLPEVIRGLPREIGLSPVDPEDRSELGWALRARARRRALAPDLVHAHLSTPALLGAAWLIAGIRTPLVVTFHLLPSGENWGRDHLARVLTPRMVSAFSWVRPRHVFCAVSRTDQERLAKKFPREEVALTPNAPPLPPVNAEAGAPLEYPPGSVRLLSVGRLHEQKGFDRLLRALASPALRDLDWHWIVVGGGSEREALERMRRELGVAGRVSFAGERAAHGLFGGADLLLCPSRYEGMPLVPLEGLSEKIPVVASSIPPHRELFAGASRSLLPENESDWPGFLSRLIADAAERSRLRDEQAVLSREDPRSTLWKACEAAYARALGDG